MDEYKIDNDFFNDNYHEEVKNTLIKSIDSEEKAPDYNEINEDIFTYSSNKSDSPQKDVSHYTITQNKTQIPIPIPINYSNKKSNIINNNENSFLDSPQKQNEYNMNEDISGISLLKELEEQWNNIEKQKINYYNRNRGDESTNNNSKYNNNNSHEKFKYIKDMVECKKNKFLALRQKSKNERNNDHDIEQYFLTKFKEMEKYKIIDKNLKEKIEIRQQEKIYEKKMEHKNKKNINNNDDNYYDLNQNQNQSQSVNENYNINNNYVNDNNNYYNENENENEIIEEYENDNIQPQIREEIIQDKKRNNYNKKSFLQNEENDNKINNYQEQNNFYDNNKMPELEDLIYETPARNSNNFNNNTNNNNDILEKIRNNNNYNNNFNYNNNYNEEIENEDNNNSDVLNKIDKSNISGKLVEKMKDLFEEIKGDNNPKMHNQFKYNTIKKAINPTSKGILGINNINIINNNYTDNKILMNIRNSNSNRNNNKTINDANKTINDANKSINLNFNYNNYDNNYLSNIKNDNQNNSLMNNNNQNFQIFENNKDKYSNQNEILINKDISFHSKNEISNGLSCLEKNFDDILKQIKSGFNTSKANKNSIKLNFFNNNNNFISNNNENEQFPELDKYFEELSKEAKLKVKQGKMFDNQKYQQENKIENNTNIYNKYNKIQNKNKNKNTFKQRLIEINKDLNNYQKKEENIDIYKRKDIFRNKNINAINHQRSLSEFRGFPI